MNVVIQGDKLLLEQIKQYYADDIDFNSKIPYTQFVVSAPDIKVIAYTTNKVMFQGKNAQLQASMWTQQQVHDNKEEEILSKPGKSINEYIGSDEVGTGDYFGPVVVCAAYINNDIASKIAHLNLTDSKVYTDAQIRTYAKELKNIVPHYVYVLDNEKYNKNQPTNNLNMIKAKMHNYAIRQCMKIVNKKVDVVVDQFTPPKSYYSYLVNTKDIVCDIIFETKAESKYLGVALASILARNAFLECLDEMEKQLKMPIPKGAGAKVDLFGAEIVSNYGEEILDTIAKKHFKNTEKIMKILKQ